MSQPFTLGRNLPCVVKVFKLTWTSFSKKLRADHRHWPTIEQQVVSLSIYDAWLKEIELIKMIDHVSGHAVVVKACQNYVAAGRFRLMLSVLDNAAEIYILEISV
jgi:hypothetical protein